MGLAVGIIPAIAENLIPSRSAEAVAVEVRRIAANAAVTTRVERGDD